MEKSTRKRKHSNLRVSLGRKSVGDRATFEEVPDTSSNVSCHLNPDSAVIDPDHIGNPDWVEHLPQNSVLVSQNSINEAILNERDANIVNDSNIEGLNLSSFNKRDINKFLNSSVVVNKSEIDRLTKRKQRVPSEDADSELSEEDNVSVEIQRRRPTTLKRGAPKDAGKSLEAYKAFQAVAHDASDLDEETVPSVNSKNRSKVSSTSKSDRKSKLPSDENESIEIIRKRPAFLKRGKKGTNDEIDAELYNVFKEVRDHSSDSEEGASSSKKVAQSPSSTRDNSATEDVSIIIPRRRPNFLQKNSKKNRKESVDAYKVFEEVRDQTSDSLDDTEVNEAGSQKTLQPSCAPSPKSAALTHEPESPEASDVSLEIRRRRPKFLVKGSRKDSNTFKDACKAFLDVMEQTVDSEQSNDVSNHILQSSNTNEKSANSKPPANDDVSLEIPQRRPAFLKKNSKQSTILLDAYNAFQNVTSGSEEEVEAAKENHPFVNRTPCDPECDVSLPLGAEALNFGDVPDDIPSIPKRSLSLKKLQSGNRIDLLSQVTEEDVIKDSQSSLRAPMGSNFGLKSPGPLNLSKVTSIASATENTRSAPLRVSHIGQQEHLSHASIHVSPSVKEIHMSNVGGDLSKLSVPSHVQLPNEDHSIRSMRSVKSINLSSKAIEEQTSFKAGTPQRNASLLNVQNISQSKDPSHQSLPSQGNHHGSESDRSVSNKNSASTVSLPSNITSNLPSLKSQASYLVSESTSKHALTETGSNTIFYKRRSMSSSRCKSQSDTPPVSLPEMGSDSVFLTDISKAGGTNLSSHANAQMGDVSHESSWTENPYVTIPRGKTRKESPDAESRDAESSSDESDSSDKESEPFEEELSSIEAVDVDNNLLEDNASSSTKEHNSNRENMLHSSVSHASTAGSSHLNSASKPTSPSNGALNKSQVKIPSIFSPLPDRASLAEPVRPQPTVAGKEAPGTPKMKLRETRKEYDENYLEKMKAYMANWQKEVQSGLHISKPLPSNPKPPVVKKPNPKPTPKQTKKKEVCPYLKDYHPPKRIKPKPYVTAHMYKFLERKLQPKFGLESRIKAEEFVSYLCDTVTSVTRSMTKTKYHKLVFKLRDKMVSLGIVKTQLEFHVFIEDYLPDSFRSKSIPCYGCSKGPKLDTNDLMKDLSVK